MDLPPGQIVTKVWPLYTALGTADVKPNEVKISVYGAVENKLEFNWDELMKLPKVKKVLDFHCVTRWSRIGDEWEGVSLKSILNKAKPDGSYIMFHCYEGYTTNLPINYIDENSMLAYNFNGKPLEKNHGGPLRAFIPSLYGWKSAKWIHSIEVMKEDTPGFWEERGYNMRGDYTKEERYLEGVSFVDKVSAILNFKKENKE
ncbi:MAG: molybdopterin-dependent oxidoreductase [Candidatus Micrarchaeales archaeon]